MTGRPAVALAALLAGLAIVMVVWLSIDRRPPEWDHANHLERAVLCQRSLTEPAREALREIIAESSFYPPIVTCAAGLLGFVLPPLAAAHAVMWAALVMGTLAVLGLGRRLLDPAAGLLAALARRDRARGLVWAALAPTVIFFLIQNKNLRYTLPLLPAAALAAATAVAALGPRARRAVSWACVVVGVLQVGSAAFAMPSPTVLAPVVPMVAFSRPPDARDWHHRELLAAIVAAAGPGGARVAVVANDNFFSVSNFRYEVVRDRLPLRLSRAWDQAPMAVDFAIVKTGDQGPDAASAKPDRIMAALGGGDPWLAAAFPVIARVPLPDGSEGMVRMRRLEPVRALTAAQLAERLRRGAEALLAEVVREARGLRITLDYRDEALQAGRIDGVTLEAESALVGEFARRKPPLRIGPVRVRASGILVNPGRLAATGAVELLDVRSLAVERLGVAQEDLAEFLARQRGLSGLGATMERCGIAVHWSLPGPDLRARLGLDAGPESAPFTLRADRVSYGGVRLPALLVHWIVRNFDPTPRLRRLPMAVSVAPISIGAGRLEVGTDPDPLCPPRESH